MTTLAFYWDTYQDAGKFQKRIWDVIGHNLTDITDLTRDFIGGDSCLLVEVYCPTPTEEKLALAIAREV